MTRVLRLLTAAGVTAAVLTAGAAAAGATSEVQLTPLQRLPFPQRGFVVDLAHPRAIQPGDVRVLVNGKPLSHFSLTPLGRSGASVGIVVAIDTSDSMHGAPLQQAYAAARRFALRLRATGEVAVLTFNSATAVQAPLGTSSHALAAAMTAPPGTASGTHIYDAVAKALRLLGQRDFAVGAVVLLSDGADTGSHTSEALVAGLARAAHARVFTIGLRSGTFVPQALTRLAADTGGDYAAASSPKQLDGIYSALAMRLTQEYVLRYNDRSYQLESVRVDIAGVGAAFGASPAGHKIVGPFHRSLVRTFWAWRSSYAAIGVLAGMLIFLALLVLLWRPPSNIALRLSRFISLPGEDDGADEKARPRLLGRLGQLFAHLFARTAWWERFVDELEIAEIDIPPEQIVAGTVLATALAALLLGLISPIFGVLALMIPFASRSLCQRRLQMIRQRFSAQLPENLQILASALRAGHSFTSALAVVAAEGEEPSRREFDRVVRNEQLGIAVDDSLRQVAVRMASADLEQVALVAELQRQTGGNMAEVLDRVIETIRGRFELQRLVKTLTAQGRMARWIVTLLPVVIGLAISVVNPGYLDPLFHSNGGRVALMIGIVLVTSGSLVIRKIINIRV
jgi:tight adherence protein B